MAEPEPGAGLMEALRRGSGDLLPNLETSVPQVIRNRENMSLEILRQKDIIGVE